MHHLSINGNNRNNIDKHQNDFEDHTTHNAAALKDGSDKMETCLNPFHKLPLYFSFSFDNELLTLQVVELLKLPCRMTPLPSLQQDPKCASSLWCTERSTCDTTSRILTTRILRKICVLMLRQTTYYNCTLHST